MKRGLYFFCAIAAIIAFAASCTSEPKKTDTKTDFEESLTEKDTADVKNLVDQFFSYALSGDYNHAASMLYRIEDDGRNIVEPQPLTNEEMDQVRTMFELLRIEDYRIEYIKFSEMYENEVMCSCIIIPESETQKEVSTKIFFKPVNYLGGWSLCLTNSAFGDRGLVDPDKVDSLEQVYQQSDAAQADAPAE